MTYPWRKWQRPPQPIHSCTSLPIPCDSSIVNLRLHIEVDSLRAPAPVFPCSGGYILTKSLHRRPRWRVLGISGKPSRCLIEIFGLVASKDPVGCCEGPETRLAADHELLCRTLMLVTDHLASLHLSDRVSEQGLALKNSAEDRTNCSSLPYYPSPTGLPRTATLRVTRWASRVEPVV